MIHSFYTFSKSYHAPAREPAQHRMQTRSVPVRIPAALLYLSLFLLLLLPGFAAAGESSLAQDTMLSQYYQWLEKGEAALPEILVAAKGAEWRMRTHGLLALGKLGNHSHIPLILDRLENDPNPAVKNCAVIALGDLNAASALPSLLNAIDHNTKSPKNGVFPQQRLVVQSLGKIEDRRAVSPLCRFLLSERDEQIRIEVRKALIAIGDPAASRILLDAAKNASYPYVQAAEIQGALPIDGSEVFLIDLLGNHRIPVRNAAAVALANAGRETAVAPLLIAFKTADPHLRENIGAALAAIDSPSAVIPLCGYLDGDPQAAMAAADVLARLSTETAATEVFARFKTNHRINAPAAYVLGRKHFQPALPDLRSRLENAAEPGPDEMAEALGLLDDRESIPLLMAVARRENRHGSAGAIWALGRLKAEPALPMLIEMLARRDRQLTAPLIDALGQIGDARAVPPLIDLYYGSGLQYQMQIGLALAGIGGPEVVEFVKAGIDSGDARRQKMAGYIMLKSGDKVFIPHAIQLLDHPDESIRRYAVGALRNITGLAHDTVAEWRNWEAGNH